MCFLQFLTSQGDMLKLIYVGAAVNTKVFRCVGVEQVETRKCSRLVREARVSGPDTRRRPPHVIVWAPPGEDLLCKSLHGFLRCTLEGEETVWKRTDLGHKVIAKYTAAVGLDQSQRVKN